MLHGNVSNIFPQEIRAFRMVEKNSTSFFQTFKNYAGNNFSQILCFIIIAIVVIATFGLQNGIVGFEGGYDDFQPKHHGWVSANTLSIISKATPQNFFVGYALASRDDKGVIHYDYFDRYPVFFSATFNRILSLEHTLADQIRVAKQLMNFIFLATLIVAFLLLDKLTDNKALSLTVTLLTFSNPFLLWYKDMVHFDQPALFGFLLLTYAIALFKLDGNKTPVYICTLVAIGLGRGYASYGVLIVWLGIETLIILTHKELDLREKFKSILWHPSFRLLIIGIVWGGALLSYNVIIEAYKTNVSIIHTSIVHSARSRLSLNPEFNENNEDNINLRRFTQVQIERILQWTFPMKGMDFGPWKNGLLLAGMFLVMGIMVWRQDRERRIIYLIMILSGFAWLFPLRNLAAFHDYTAMYYIGIPLVFFLSVLMIFNTYKRAAILLVILGAIIYISALVQVRDWHEARAGTASAYTYDFMRILDKIDGTGNNVNMAEVILYGPFPPGFYLSQQYLTYKNIADYVVSRNRKYLPDNLTPDNQVIFLFKK
jgi:hypothetical protein